MKPYCEIEFTTTQSHNGLTAGKTCYQGHLQHNAVLPEKETRRRFAEYCCEDRSRADRYLNALGEFIAEGRREFTVTGRIPPVHPSQQDEGVWLEDDTGRKIAVATVVSSTLSHTDCTLEGSSERGDYWIVVQCRDGNDPNLIRCRRRIKAV